MKQGVKRPNYCVTLPVRPAVRRADTEASVLGRSAGYATRWAD